MLKMLFDVIGGDEKVEKSAMLERILSECDSPARRMPDGVDGPAGRRRHTFDSQLPNDQLSIANVTARQRMKMLPVMVPLMRAMGRSSRLYASRFEPKANEASPEFLREFEELALSMGAMEFGWARIPDHCIFEGKRIPHRQAFVYTVQMDKEAIDTAPSFEAFLEVARGYKALAQIGNRLSQFARKKGHGAYPGTALGGLTDYPRLAEIAGIGAIGYHGVLITPASGALLRVNTIYVSFENIPEQRRTEHDWVREFCSRCRKCIRSCPPKAIHEEPKAVPSAHECIDADACLDYFSRNFGCAICIDVCPFSQNGYETLAQRFKGNPGAPRFDIPVERLTRP